MIFLAELVKPSGSGARFDFDLCMCSPGIQAASRIYDDDDGQRRTAWYSKACKETMLWFVQCDCCVLSHLYHSHHVCTIKII